MEINNTLDTSMYPSLTRKWFTIIPVTSQNFTSLQASIVRAYKLVFSASTWKEGKKCSKWCGKKWTFEDAPESCCDNDTIDYYSDTEVGKSILTVLNKTYNQCLVCLSPNGDAAGFTWWWSDNLADINREKLKLDPEWYTRLIDGLATMGLDPGKQDWYYQSETGVVPQYRPVWVIWPTLIRVNEDLLKTNRDKVTAIIQRTSENASMSNMRRRLGYQKVFGYEDTDNRVLFAKRNC